MFLSKSENNPDAVLPKVITPTMHGIIDYCHAAFFFTVGLLCARSQNKAAARAAYATSGFILVQSLLTDYRFGANPSSRLKRTARWMPCLPQARGCYR